MLAFLNKRGISLGIFICGFILLFIFFDLPSILVKSPQSVHLQRQTDGASYALNYYQNKQPFFKSQVHQRFAENGYAVSEFPIIYFLASKLYGLFGVHDYYIRMIHFFLFVIGIIYIYKLSLLSIRNKFFQFLPVLLFFSSSYIQYYASNFLPDVASISLAFIGLYYFVLFKKENKYSYFLTAGIFFTIAGLLKISAMILWVSILIFFIYERIQSYRDKQTDKLQVKAWLIFLLSFLVLLVWLLFAKYYALKYHYGGNLLGFYPIWDASLHEVLSICHRLVIEWMGIIMIWPMWLLICVMFIYLVKWRKQLATPLFSITMISGFGCFVYSLCWFRAFYHHDYYMINLFCFPVLILLLFLSSFEKILIKQTLAIQCLTYAFIFVIAGYSVLNCAITLQDRYSASKYYTINQSLYKVEPYLRKIGIDRNDLVVSIPDSSTNISLYLMNQSGWTECFNSPTYNIYNFIPAGAAYLIVSDSNYIHKEIYSKFCVHEKKIGEFEGIFIYDLK